ncbi:MAG: sensor histidine kinase, partial [Rhodothermales bacterium]
METIKHGWSRLFAANAYERDPGFREVMLRLNRKGMLAAGILGIVGVLANVGAYASSGWSLVWHYGDPIAIILWDRLIIIVIGAAYLVLAFTRFGPRWARPLSALIVLLLGLTVLFDDFYQDFYQAEEGFHSDRYLSIAMLVIVAAISYPPRQAFLYFFSIWGVYLLSFWIFPTMLGLEVMVRSPGFFVYVSIVPIACTFISMLLYHTRYEQYAALQKSEHLTEQLEVQAEQLQEMDRLKARFFANISHEFRTPLTLLLGPIQDALNSAYGSFSDRYTHQLAVMQRNALRQGKQLINELLALSKVDAGRMTPSLRPGNLTRFLREIVSSFAALAERKDVMLEFHSEPEALSLAFDADKVEKMITNLLSNAFKYTPDTERLLFTNRHNGIAPM